MSGEEADFIPLIRCRSRVVLIIQKNKISVGLEFQYYRDDILLCLGVSRLVKTTKKLTPSQIKFYRKLLVVLSVISMCFVAGSVIELPLPAEEKGTHYLRGNILRCDISRRKEYNQHLQIYLDNNGESERLHLYHLSWSEANYYRGICRANTEIKVWFISRRTLISPAITYKVVKLEVIDNEE